MFQSRFVILFLLWTCYTFYAQGQQVVHIENKRIGSKKPGWTGNVGLRVEFIQNIDKIFQAGNNFSLYYNRPKSKWMFLHQYDHMRLNKDNLVNNTFQHIRYNHPLSERFTWEAFAQHQFNEIMGVALRMLTGTGPRLGIVQQDTLNLFVGSLYMYEYEYQIGVEGFGLYHRISTYVSAGWRHRNRVEFDLIAYLQPNIFDWDDTRISGELTFSVKITDRLALSIIGNILYDSNPAPGIPPVFYTLNNGLTYDFRFGGPEK